jgi:release factor glutamine methyltransferase
MNHPGRRTVIEILRLSTGYLEEHGVESPRLTAEILLSDVLGCRRIDLYLWFDRPMEEAELAVLRRSLRERARGVPVEYITGKAEFYGLRLRVSPAVLIPRPETEVLVEHVLNRVEGLDLHREGTDCFRLLDLGTGSGAIALALLSQLPGSRAVGVDISLEALRIAAENARELGLAHRFHPVRGDLDGPIGAAAAFDLLVSNPPYIADVDREGLPREVREHEPPEALFAGPDGYRCLRRVISAAPAHLKPGGILAVEIGYGQGKGVVEAVGATPGMVMDGVETDLGGIERIVLARKEG